MRRKKKPATKSEKVRARKPEGELNEEQLDQVSGGLTSLSGATLTEQPLDTSGSRLNLFDDNTAVGTGDGTTSPEETLKRIRSLDQNIS